MSNASLPKISILVPVYNVEKYLAECMNSIIGQTLKDLEIICIDDGSADASPKILDEFAAKDCRIKVIHKENSGYGKSMNLGLKTAMGKYIGIVESDDFIDADMFETLYLIAEEHKTDIVRSDHNIYINGKDEYYNAIGSYFYNKVISAYSVPTVFEKNPAIWSNLYNRRFLLDNNIRFTETPGASFQDIAFHLKNFMCAERVFFVPKAFYHYRRDNENASVKSTGKLFCVCGEYDEAERFMNEHPGFAERYGLLMPFLRSCHYTWNCYGRNLDLKDCLSFLNRMYDEYRALDKDGRLEKNCWSSGQWQQVQQLLTDKNQFIVNILSTVQHKRLKKYLTDSLFLNYDNKQIALYGAGQVGRKVLTALTQSQKKVDCFIVSKRTDTENIDGIPVLTIDEATAKKDDYVVIISVAQKTQAEIFAELARRKFPHIILLDDLIRKILL